MCLGSLSIGVEGCFYSEQDERRLMNWWKIIKNFYFLPLSLLPSLPATSFLFKKIPLREERMKIVDLGLHGIVKEMCDTVCVTVTVTTAAEGVFHEIWCDITFFALRIVSSPLLLTSVGLSIALHCYFQSQMTRRLVTTFFMQLTSRCHQLPS